MTVVLEDKHLEVRLAAAKSLWNITKIADPVVPVLADLLSRIQTPVQIIAGAHDTTVPPVNAEFLHQRLPHSRLDIIDAGHFTWEDAAVEYSALITNWWRGDYAATGPR